MSLEVRSGKREENNEARFSYLFQSLSLSLSLSSVSVLSRLVRSCVAQERFSKYAFFIFFFGIALVIALKEEGEDEEEEERKSI